ncbi:Hypothetical Protein XCAW_02821 [Xanthomonas citri subsp. citri Aw12879]|uniref:Uncharacterized protein n=1 Tax=Xanthomonas citri pv. citri TaxID=611301 RepID=A0A0U5FBP0_XANCI|nr:Hypothetical Protein XCAW_02821 [Xanthomonas citri subsp. citri Aw12879]CEE21628.1 exported hypothetical protein [Xanthomonas citri pv. citri]CEE23256.1 exported hypothetical protein [Xanthomonas citri pv. citri]CEE37989.1 exported hypothetical protein [Xanthomonas citri pv. citri]CEE60395.1 exported hypothetical protein [Xanthomonas citri pv. citri]
MIRTIINRRDTSRCFLLLFACYNGLFVSSETASHRESDAHGFCEANNHMWALTSLFF